MKFSSDEGQKFKSVKPESEEEEKDMEEEQEEIQYGVDSREVMNCLRQVSRPDGLSVSGEVSPIPWSARQVK